MSRGFAFDDNDIHVECGEPRALHKTTIERGRYVDEVIYQCPDLSLPDPSADDDPWEDVHGGRAPVEQLFDKYD